MSSLRKWRSRPAASKSPSDAAQAQPKDWGTKEVVRFLEQQGLNAYAPAAKKSKLKGTHLLNAATTPFFTSPHISTSPATFPPPSSPSPPSTQPDAAGAPSKAGGVPQLRVSASSPNFGTLTRSKSFIFGPAIPRSNSNLGPGGGGESEAALRRLCDRLGVLSVVDKRRLWLALLMLQRQQDELQTKAQASKHHHNNGGSKAMAVAAEPAVGLPCAIKPFAASEKCIALRRDRLAARLRSSSASPPAPEPDVFSGGKVPKAAAAEAVVDDPLPEDQAGRKRSSSFSSVPLTTNSDDFFAVEPTRPSEDTPAKAPAPAPVAAVQSPSTGQRGSIRRKASREQAGAAGLPEELVAALSTSGSAAPTRKNRSSIGPVAAIRKWMTPAAAQAAPAVTPPESPSLSLSSSSSSSSLSSSSSSSSSEESRATLPANPLAASSRTIRTAASSQRSATSRAKQQQQQQARRNPSLAYVERHGVLVVKCCLQLSALTVIDTCSMAIVPTRSISSDSDNESAMSPSSSSSSDDEVPDVAESQLRRKRAESTYYDDISLLRLDGRRPLLYADLMAEVNRLHGPLLLAILMQEGAKGVVRISYRDAEGDLVGIQSDDALRYAYEDWRKQARIQPRKHTFMRLLVEVESTSPQCNK